MVFLVIVYSHSLFCNVFTSVNVFTVCEHLNYPFGDLKKSIVLYCIVYQAYKFVHNMFLFFFLCSLATSMTN